MLCGQDGPRPPNEPGWGRLLFPVVLWARFLDIQFADGWLKITAGRRPFTYPVKLKIYNIIVQYIYISLWPKVKKTYETQPNLAIHVKTVQISFKTQYTKEMFEINVKFVFVYIYLGLVALIWCGVWFTNIAESPIEDKHITKEELKYIINSIGPINDNKSK